MSKKQCDALLACRVGGTRLYGKPMQYLDIQNKVTILEYLIRYINELTCINSICLAIADGKENHCFAGLAEKNGWKYFFGSEDDMLGRIIKAADYMGTEIAFIGSTESPFLYHEKIDILYDEMCADNVDYASISQLPDGANFILMNKACLETSHKNGTQRNRELVGSYVYDNKDKFKIHIIDPEPKLRRSDIRITIDYPEDLVFCRAIYRDLKGSESLIKQADIIDYWDGHEELRKPVESIGVDWGHGRIWE